MTPKLWQSLARAVEESMNSPAWLKQQVQLSWKALSRLPVVDQTTTGQHAIPTVEQKAVSEDYLIFLREQIELGSRGPEWSAVLKKRLNALEPFVGSELLVVTFYYKPHSATIRLNPETGEVVHIESAEGC